MLTKHTSFKRNDPLYGCLSSPWKYTDIAFLHILHQLAPAATATPVRWPAGLLSILTTLERVSKICFAIISIIILLVLLSKYSKDCTNKRKLSPIKIPLFMIYNYITFDICRNCNVLHCFLLCFSQVGSIAVFFHWKSLNICKRKFISIYRKIKLPYHYFHFIFSIEYWFSNIFLRSLLELQFVLILQPYISRRNRKNNFFTW